MSEIRKLITQIYEEVFIKGNEPNDLVLELLKKTNYDLEGILELAGKTLGMEKYTWFCMYLLNWIIHSQFLMAS
ncbi:hypothetical protein DRO21_06165 [archaeon]|nr:MAG: hypothetical protein DRO21_06165 [archaeon]